MNIGISYVSICLKYSLINKIVNELQTINKNYLITSLNINNKKRLNHMKIVIVIIIFSISLDGYKLGCAT